MTSCSSRRLLPLLQVKPGLKGNSGALYPHMKVFDNMAFSLKLAKVDSGTIK
jgi:ABC-type proline/glycine betaine transport system ATPase subunit